MAGMEQYPEEWRQYEPIQPRGTDWRGLLRKLWAPIAAIGAFLAKFGVVLLKFKFLFSMFVSLAFYVWLGGWWFGVGLIALLFVHEMGHVLEAKRQGLPVSARGRSTSSPRRSIHAGLRPSRSSASSSTCST